MAVRGCYWRSQPPRFAARKAVPALAVAAGGERVVASHGIHLRRWPARWGRGAGVSRRLLVGLLVVLSAALAVAGAAGTVRYVGTFWLYRGFAAPSTAPSVSVSGPGGTRHVRVVPASVETFSVASP